VTTIRSGILTEYGLHREWAYAEEETDALEWIKNDSKNSKEAFITRLNNQWQINMINLLSPADDFGKQNYEC
jgi:hypothetical protein